MTYKPVVKDIKENIDLLLAKFETGQGQMFLDGYSKENVNAAGSAGGKKTSEVVRKLEASGSVASTKVSENVKNLETAGRAESTKISEDVKDLEIARSAESTKVSEIARKLGDAEDLGSRKAFIIGIDGRCASGKSTLAQFLAREYDCNLFHMDDFFLQVHQRTPQRYETPGGNVDYERMEEEVFKQILAGKSFSYRPFNCQTMDFDEGYYVKPKTLNIVEGSYSHHSNLEKYYDLKIFLDLDPLTQSERILARNGPVVHKKFINEWIPLEEKYCDQHFELEELSKDAQKIAQIVIATPRKFLHLSQIEVRRRLENILCKQGWSKERVLKGIQDLKRVCS